MSIQTRNRYNHGTAVIPSALERWIAAHPEADRFGPTAGNGPTPDDDDGEGLVDSDLNGFDEADEAVDFWAQHARDMSVTDEEAAECALAERQVAFLRQCEVVVVLAEPRDCPACTGSARGCGICGGLGFVAGAEWATAVQRAFVGAAALVLVEVPCQDDDDMVAAFGEPRTGCRCRHNTADPERGCECGYAEREDVPA